MVDDAASSFAGNDNEKNRGKEGTVSPTMRGKVGNCFTASEGTFIQLPMERGKKTEETRQFYIARYFDLINYLSLLARRRPFFFSVPLVLY